MSYFACIYFHQTNILLSKVEIQQSSYLNSPNYRVQLHKPLGEMGPKEWARLEKKLVARDVEYVVMDMRDNPFEQIKLVTGEELKRYLGVYLLHYIYKYKLITKDKFCANIGIIGGSIGETLDITMSIIDEVVDLTYFIDDPSIYKEVISEIYSATRLKAKAKVASRYSIAEMDIIFNLDYTTCYAKWCKPQAIYIDMKKQPKNKVITFEGSPPMMWYDFELLCDRQVCSIPMLQAAFYSQGIYKRSFLNELKKLDTNISRVYTTRIS